MKSVSVKLLSLMLALVLALGCAAYAEEDDPVVVSFNGGEIRKSEAQSELDYVIDYYSQFGYDVSEYPDWVESIRLEVLEMLVTDKVIDMKLAEDGVQLISDERAAEIRAKAEAEYNDTVAGFAFASEDDEEPSEDDTEDTLNYLESIGYTLDSVVNDYMDIERSDAAYRYIAGDIEVTEEDILNAYNEQLAADTELYGEDISEYEYACQYEDSLITWNPEGFRRVKQIVFTSYDDEVLEKLYELLDTKEQLTEDDEIAAIDGQIAALYESLLPTVDECVARIEAGEDFDALIEEYSSDESSQVEPFKTQGYPIYADSIMYENAMRDAAMALESIGDVSEPVQGDYGIYIVKYVSDITPGAIPLSEVYDQVKSTAENNRMFEAYDAKVAEWLAEANVEYFPENLD